MKSKENENHGGDSDSRSDSNVSNTYITYFTCIIQYIFHIKLYTLMVCNFAIVMASDYEGLEIASWYVHGIRQFLNMMDLM